MLSSINIHPPSNILFPKTVYGIERPELSVGYMLIDG
jgi:hypothetical protein